MALSGTATASSSGSAGSAWSTPTACRDRGRGDVLGPDEAAASTGSPVPQVEVTVVDPTGVPVPIGTPGEIWVRGPSTAAVYRTAVGTVPVTEGLVGRHR